MNLLVKRGLATPYSTPGELDVDGSSEAYTLEPANPIPAGTYKVVLLPSPHFGCIVPHVLDVPGHTAIEIHWGNYPHDTHDCLLVGYSRATDFVGSSKGAFEQLMQKLSGAPDITITYMDYVPDLAG